MSSSGMSAVCASAFNPRAISKPLPSGRRTSSTMRSGRSAASRTASAAVSPSVTRYPPSSRTRVSTQRLASVSSTTRTLMTGRSDIGHLDRPGAISIIVRPRGRSAPLVVEDGQHQCEHGTPSDLTLHRDIAAEQPCEPAREGQPEPRSLHTPLHRALDLRELLEDSFEVDVGNPDPRIGYHEQDRVVIALPCRHAHLTALGELERVGDEVPKNLS